jgi:hypothetical protein
MPPGSSPLKIDISAFGGQAPLRPMPGAGVTRIETVRAHSVGGKLLEYTQSEQLLYFEQLYRKLPVDGLYNATPNHPITFTMGSFKVLRNQVLVILDYNFDIYRFSGAAAGDYVPIENNRLSTQVGWDITVNAQRPGALQYQIIPGVPTQSQQPYGPTAVGSTAQDWEFELVRAAELQGPAGPALSMMPQRHHRNGLVKVANNYVVKANGDIVVSCSVFNRIPIPIAFFEANITGILMPQATYEAYQAANGPTGNPDIANLPGAEG